jgi:hypothetical protein
MMIFAGKIFHLNTFGPTLHRPPLKFAGVPLQSSPLIVRLLIGKLRDARQKYSQLSIAAFFKFLWVAAWPEKSLIVSPLTILYLPFAGHQNSTPLGMS